LDPSKEKKQQIPGYKLLTRLGTGGQANVYKAVQISMNRHVAVKVITPEQGVPDTELGRFMREARVLARLRHENIVQAIDYGESEGIRYLVMEFIEGKSVLEIIENEGALGNRRSIEIVIQICRALEHAAGFGVVHRDVKPANIVITKTNRAVLVDFGLARPEETDLQLTMTGTTVGTPHYMSPEQIRSVEKLDIRSDIYALGATFFHMLVGVVPFPMQSKAEIMASHLREEVKLPKNLPAGVPEYVFDIIRTAMEKDREDRYASAREMLAALTASRQRLPQQTQVDMPVLGRQEEELARKLSEMAAERDRLAEHARQLEERLRSIETAKVLKKPTATQDVNAPGTISEVADVNPMLLVEAGFFSCGEDEGKDVDTPRREVNVDSFWMDLYPVTNHQFARFVAETDRVPPKHWDGNHPPGEIANHPVVWVSWQDAVEFAAWAGKRLATPLEWQKAARGTDGRQFPWGEIPDPRRCNCKEISIGGTTAVGQYKNGVSPYDLHDMAGNVAEWVFGKFNVHGPSDVGQVIRAVCGGSWRDSIMRSRCASRRGYRDGGKAPYVGFRCARDAK